MIKIKNIKSKVIAVKEPLPQVGSNKLEYSNLSDVNDGVYDFIINNDKELLLGRGHWKLNKKNTTLYFAGEVEFKKGEIIMVNNNSGHYQPNQNELNNIIELLIENDVINPTISIVVFNF